MLLNIKRLVSYFKCLNYVYDQLLIKFLLREKCGKKCWEQDGRCTPSITDFRTAYDTVWRKEIQSEMNKIDFPQKII